MNTPDRIAEVIEASTTRLVAQCYRLYEAPPLGALVRAGPHDDGVYGVLTGIATQGLDPGRKPIARGQDAETEASVYDDHPQLARLLRTTLDVVTVGHTNGASVLQHLPPYPPRIHAFLYTCPPEEVRAFTATLDFLPLLLAVPSPATDEAVASLLRAAAPAHPDAPAFLLRAGRELARLLGGDPPRLNTLLRRLAP